MDGFGYLCHKTVKEERPGSRPYRADLKTLEMRTLREQTCPVWDLTHPYLAYFGLRIKTLQRESLIPFRRFNTRL